MPHDHRCAPEPGIAGTPSSQAQAGADRRPPALARLAPRPQR